MIRKTQINYQDNRGLIKDILVSTDIDAATYITFSPESVRGNHFHKKTTQYDYIISGKLILRTRKGENSAVEEFIVEAGDLITHPSSVWHAYKAIEDSVMFSFTKGPRQGDKYEEDTFRLESEHKLF